ncbi:hypothetical protein PSAC2689_150099 [Paraburkholderia sacchari]
MTACSARLRLRAGMGAALGSAIVLSLECEFRFIIRRRTTGRLRAHALQQRGFARFAGAPETSDNRVYPHVIGIPTRKLSSKGKKRPH